MIHLAEATIDEQDMDALADWIKTYPRLTKGKLTIEYEDKWAEWLGTKHSTFVNSGSSANLLMLATLLEAGDLEPGDAVIVPALSWATDLAPVMQLGLEPILCDCNLADFSCDLDHFEEIIRNGVIRVKDGMRMRIRPKAAILVSVLGLVPHMERIAFLCDKAGVILLEDCCESLGSADSERKLGTFGAMSTFSTYFGHHISTIEGGMVCTDNDRYDKIMKSVRSHGWARDWSKEEQDAHCEEWDVSEFDSFYTFFHAGFNLRATDLQAFLGLRQLDKLNDVCMSRWRNFNLYNEYLNAEHRLEVSEELFTSNFAFPILTEQRDEIAERLISNDIECRPLICGSMGKQPFYVKKYGEQTLPNAEAVRKYGMYLPNHHLLSKDDIKKICEIVNG
jgi:CDP-6-deoxy-D-xylo-4-hexulose-3-dehydrase